MAVGADRLEETVESALEAVRRFFKVDRVARFEAETQRTVADLPLTERRERNARDVFGAKREENPDGE
jgi:hypothetical protein